MKDIHEKAQGSCALYSGSLARAAILITIIRFRCVNFGVNYLTSG